MSKKIAYYGIFSALAILMGYVEAMIQFPIPVPGIKLGLSNVIVVMAIYLMDNKAGFYISIIRVLVTIILFKGTYSLPYSLTGAILSYLIMIIAKRNANISIVGVSVLGGIFHNIGQIMVAILILGRNVIIYLVPFLMVSGVLTGAVIGIIARNAIPYIKFSR